MNEIRCAFCSRLLAQVDVAGQGMVTIRIKCKCRAFTTKRIKIAQGTRIVVQNVEKSL